VPLSGERGGERERIYIYIYIYIYREREREREGRAPVSEMKVSAVERIWHI